jgi:hypothetical protein
MKGQQLLQAKMAVELETKDGSYRVTDLIASIVYKEM